ncbi:DUF2243 domain-containing protein [Nitratireductor sp. GCM10026969]|uniref:DUF2243 domain-containing protein n=1 Tax=Nitratireductor sp. GCM10026969 TaxID=3252645 RepID=UPI003608CE84
MWKSPWTRWGIVLGFAFGGFFDGILLHQILQWHHLLSLVPGVADLRTQVLWDGYFHGLMYLLAALGLWGLWRAHKGAAAARGRSLSGALLVGFGIWHVVDSVLSHWVLGIHRIKLDSDNPLMWDLFWFVAFGIIPLVAGWLLLRHPRDGLGGQPRGSGSAVLLLALLTVGAAAWSLRTPPDQPFTTVVFRPGIGSQDVVSSLASTDARLVWADSSMGVVVVDIPPARRWSFYKYGALLVSGSGVPAGCFNWMGV